MASTYSIIPSLTAIAEGQILQTLVQTTGVATNTLPILTSTLTLDLPRAVPPFPSRLHLQMLPRRILSHR